MENSEFYVPSEYVFPQRPVEELIPGIKPKEGEFRPETLEGASVMAYLETSVQIAAAISNPDKRKKFLDFVKEFMGQTLIELGPGKDGTGYLLAVASGAKGYVGVEPGDMLPELLGNIDSNAIHSSEILEKPLVPAAVIRDDALGFLKRLPDRSVSVFASGLDGWIITSGQYTDEVSKEIERVLHPKGAFVNYDSAFYLDSGQFSSIRADDLPIFPPLIKYKVKSN